MTQTILAIHTAEVFATGGTPRDRPAAQVHQRAVYRPSRPRGRIGQVRRRSHMADDLRRVAA